MTIVMGLDHHRAQITAEWIDTETGEISRARVAPADRGAVRRFLERFAGQALEVALEATAGWRFVVEELRAVGGGVHLAEPAETRALRGPKKHAKSDRADARHLRELLMCGRLPECWIAPDHILHLRAQVRLRHSLVDERGEWQQRIRAVLYHHGFPRRSDLDLLTAAGRDWLTELPCPRRCLSAANARFRCLGHGWSARSPETVRPTDCCRTGDGGTDRRGSRSADGWVDDGDPAVCS